MIQNRQSPSPTEPEAATSRQYGAYLLRCWQDGRAWRFSLEPIGEGQRQGFEQIDDLLRAVEMALNEFIGTEKSRHKDTQWQLTIFGGKQ
jgi:hypothetical protein